MRLDQRRFLAILRRSTALSLLSFAALSLCTGKSEGGPADEKKACLASYEKSQELRRQGSLKSAREQFAVCARDVCPKALRGDCAKWAEEVTQSMPSVVIEGRDSAGNETVLIKVSVDGKVVAERLDGRAIEVDPGMRTIKYEHGTQSQEEKIVVREGERNRKLVADFGPKGESKKPSPDAKPDRPATEPGKQAPGPRPEPEVPTERPVPAITWVATGFAVAGAGVFATFGLLGKGKASDLKGSCAPNCTEDQVKPLRTNYLVADIGLAVGVISLGAAAITYATRPRVPVTEGRFKLDLGPTHGGAAALLSGRF